MEIKGKLKGFQALEIIFIMVILIIVTVIVINMFTHFMTTGSSGISQQIRDIQEYSGGKAAIDACKVACADYQSTCSNIDAIRFCTKVVGIDLNSNNQITDREVGSHPLIAAGQVCESMIFCPVLIGSECRCGGTTLTLAGCEEVLCNYYVENGLESEEAASRITESWIPGDCRFTETSWVDRIEGLCGTNITIS